MLLLKLTQMLLYLSMHTLAYEDKYVEGPSTVMVEKGKLQYKLLQERATLPKYGTCWKQAVMHIEDGCRALSEETQCDIALHLTNCFLEMSGHETYTCQLDKKPNLRGICINSMTDRAFNVYMEFYTHTQNICWFLRGQLWHEIISENTEKVGMQLEKSARNQEDLLNNQEKSLELQEKMLKYGLVLEQIMEDFYISSRHHQELLSVMSSSLASLQSWLLGEVSWFDTVIFYVTFGFLIALLTSNNRTSSARLPIIILLVLNIFAERLICFKVTQDNFPYDIQATHKKYYTFIWYIRYVFIFVSVLIIVIYLYYYKDYIAENNLLLHKLSSQMLDITENLNECKTSNLKNVHANIKCIEEIQVNDNTFKTDCNYFDNAQVELNSSNADRGLYNNKLNNSSTNINSSTSTLCTPHKTPPSKGAFSRVHLTNRLNGLPLTEIQNTGRYNLRSRQGTPDV